MPRRNVKRPEPLVELAKQYAEARVQEEKLYREVIMGVVESIDPHSRLVAHREAVWAEFERAVYEMAGIL